ncbi:hypothetical protein [Limnobacter sp.]|uniref:hypothetical protein n=1 Tax=Limnobacter sp. TaxID=2003368 RepID=UPI0035152FE9
MNQPPSDLWLILPTSDAKQAPEVMLLHRREHNVLAGQRMPFNEFADSALALGSFAHGDTQVLIGLPACTALNAQKAQHHWVGVAQHPDRLLIHPCTPEHIEWIEVCKRMGKTPRVVSASRPEDLRSQPCELVRMAQSEYAVLSETHRDAHDDLQGNGLNAKAMARLHLGWYLKACPGHQPIRLALAAALLCAVASTMVAAWLAGSASQATQANTVQQLQSGKTHKLGQANDAPPIDWAAWRVQVQKFGKNERANVADLAWTWNNAGEVYSIANLNKPRKRLPKGCEPLSHAAQAVCRTNAP